VASSVDDINRRFKGRRRRYSPSNVLTGCNADCPSPVKARIANSCSVIS